MVCTEISKTFQLPVPTYGKAVQIVHLRTERKLTIREGDSTKGSLAHHATFSLSHFKSANSDSKSRIIRPLLFRGGFRNAEQQSMIPGKSMKPEDG